MIVYSQMFAAQIIKEQVIRVLHVDDDQAFLQVSKEILMMENDFVVTSAASADIAKKELADGNFDVVVSDYEMPFKNGLEFLKELRENKNQIPFILFTGKGREEVAITALNLGADGYFNKQGSPETVYGELAHGLKAIVARKKTELALLESKDRFQKASAIAHVGNWEIDLRTKTIWGSDEAFKIYGLERTIDNSLPLLKVQEIVFPEQRKYLDLALQELIGNNKDYNVDFKIRRADDGAERFIHSKAELVYNQNRMPIKVNGVIQDVTENKSAEEAVRLSEEKYRKLVENAVDIICTHDLAGQVTSANRSVEKYGLRIDQVVGRNILEFITKEFWSSISSQLQDLERGSPIQGEIEIITPIGRINAEYKSNPIFKDEKIIGALTIIRDIRERKRAEKQLLEDNLKLEIVNEKLQVMGSLARHDVANKLYAIKSYAYLLKKRVNNNPELIKYIEEIDLAIDQSNKIFEFSRYYEKIGAEEPSRIDVGVSLNQAVALVPKLEIEVVNKTVGLKVLADSMLRQLFYNFIDNSIRHGQVVTKIEVSYIESSEGIKLMYEDNGIGIPEQHKEKIFSGGFTTGNGSGFGLKLVKRMAEAYDWTIKENGVPGKGAKFEITIPLKISLMKAFVKDPITWSLAEKQENQASPKFSNEELEKKRIEESKYEKT